MRQRNRKCMVYETIYAVVSPPANRLPLCSEVCRKKLNARRAREMYWASPQRRARLKKNVARWRRKKYRTDPAFKAKADEATRRWYKRNKLPITPDTLKFKGEA